MNQEHSMCYPSLRAPSAHGLVPWGKRGSRGSAAGFCDLWTLRACEIPMVVIPGAGVAREPGIYEHRPERFEDWHVFMASGPGPAGHPGMTKRAAPANGISSQARKQGSAAPLGARIPGFAGMTSWEHSGSKSRPSRHDDELLPSPSPSCAVMPQLEVSRPARRSTARCTSVGRRSRSATRCAYSFCANRSAVSRRRRSQVLQAHRIGWLGRSRCRQSSRLPAHSSVRRTARTSERQITRAMITGRS